VKEELGARETRSVLLPTLVEGQTQKRTFTGWKKASGIADPASPGLPKIDYS
jgi:hypothetical protein